MTPPPPAPPLRLGPAQVPPDLFAALSTGAVVAASTLVLGRLKGVSRPGIAVPVPTRKGPAVVIDVGANIYCKPEHMLHYAVMASE